MNDLYRMFVRPEGVCGEQGATLMEQNGGPMSHEAVGRLDLKSTDAVIEIGFGPGLGLEILARTVVEGHVTGVDPSVLMHRRAARRNAESIREGRVELVEGTVDTLPFLDDAFDAGLAVDNLHFWPDRLAGLKELRRVLRLGAPFLCAFTPVSGGSRVGLADLFATAGYADITIGDSAAGFTMKGIVVK